MVLLHTKIKVCVLTVSWDPRATAYLTVAQFIYFVAISGIAVNYVLFNRIVLNSVLNDMVNDMSVLTAK